MPRNLASLVPSVLILVVCSWLVHVEGESYRRRFPGTASDQLAKRLVPGVKPAAPLPAPIRPVETKEVSQARKPIEILKDDPVAPPSSPLKAMVSPPVRSGTPDATHTHRYQLSIGDSI